MRSPDIRIADLSVLSLSQLLDQYLMIGEEFIEDADQEAARDRHLALVEAIGRFKFGNAWDANISTEDR